MKITVMRKCGHKKTTATKQYAETTSTEVKLHLKLAYFFVKYIKKTEDHSELLLVIIVSHHSHYLLSVIVLHSRFHIT